jgi:hypothetical protein
MTDPTTPELPKGSAVSGCHFLAVPLRPFTMEGPMRRKVACVAPPVATTVVLALTLGCNEQETSVAPSESSDPTRS